MGKVLGLTHNTAKKKKKKKRKALIQQTTVDKQDSLG
jgi:hypothetical protein